MKKLSSFILIGILSLTVIGCSSSAKKTFDSIIEGVDNTEPFTVDKEITGEVIEILQDGDDVYELTIAIEGDDKYVFVIPEYALGNNNTSSSTEGNQLPNDIKIGDNLKVYTGQIQYIVPEAGNDKTNPYISGYTKLRVVKVK